MKKENAWVIVILILVLVIFAFGALVTSSASRLSSSSDNRGGNETKTEEATENEDVIEEKIEVSDDDKLLSDSEADEDEDEDIADESTVNDEESIQNGCQVGDVLEVNGAKISYLSCGEYEPERHQAKDGYKVVYVELEFENNSDNDIYIAMGDFCCYADGYDCEYYYYMDEELSGTTISPGRKKKGDVAFEVPEGSRRIEFEYRYPTEDFSGYEHVIFICDNENITEDNVLDDPEFEEESKIQEEPERGEQIGYLDPMYALPYDCDGNNIIYQDDAFEVSEVKYLGDESEYGVTFLKYSAVLKCTDDYFYPIVAVCFAALNKRDEIISLEEYTLPAYVDNVEENGEYPIEFKVPVGDSSVVNVKKIAFTGIAYSN